MFRCRGKTHSKGPESCQTAYTHDDFLKLATQQLGERRIDAIKTLIGWEDPSSTKRGHNGTPTKDTPEPKRRGGVQKLSDLGSRPPPGLVLSTSPLPDYREHPNAKWQIELLQKSLADKEELIVMLKEKITTLKSRVAMAPTFALSDVRYHTPIVSRVSSPSQHSDSPTSRKGKVSFSLPWGQAAKSSPPLGRSYPDTDFESQHLGHDIVPESPVQSSSAFLPSDFVSPNDSGVTKTPTYADVAASPATPLVLLRRSPRLSKVPDSRDSSSSPPVALGLVYFTGIKVTKLSTFRKNLKAQKLDLTPLRNISFVGASIAELLVETSAKTRFVDQAIAAGYTVDTDLDVTKFSVDNPVWLHYKVAGARLSDVVRSNFTSRALSEQRRSQNALVARYYFDWARRMEWNEAMVVPSTPPPVLQ